MAETNLFKSLCAAVAGLDRCVQLLSSSFDPPVLANVSGLPMFRHRERDSALMSFLKLVKVASHNNAAIHLIRAGHVLEVYTLCRMIDEACEDVIFMLHPLGENGEPSTWQERFLEEFWQEEFSGDDPLETHQSRDRVPREKIRAGISRIGGKFEGRDPSTEVAMSRVLAGTFSGYVHGAYPHIMELHGGNPGQFHTRGMSGTPRIRECLGNHRSYVFRSLMAAEGVASLVQRKDVLHLVLNLEIELAKQTGCLNPEGIVRMEARRARNAEASSAST
jgi:hypothetical protein